MSEDDKTPKEEQNAPPPEEDAKAEKKPSVPSLDDLPPLPEEEKKPDEGLRIPTFEDEDLPQDKNAEAEDDASPPPPEADEKSSVDFGDLGKAMSGKEQKKAEDSQNQRQGPRAPDENEAAAKYGEINYVTSDVVDLSMGDDIGLTNKDPTLKKIIVGAGWEARSLEGDDPDLDLSCFIYNKDRQTRKDKDFVFYNNRESEEGELRHMGDSRTGAGEGDDEMVQIDLQAFPFDVAGIMLVISIHDGEVKDQDLTMVKDMFVRIVNAETSQEMCKLEIPDAFLAEEGGYAIKVGRIFRDGPKWRFHANVEVIKKGGLRAVATEYGIIVV